MIKTKKAKSGEDKILEYNRSLLMPRYDHAIVEDVARKKSNNILTQSNKVKKHKYGEAKEAEYKFRLCVAEVMEDVCRINNWTTKNDFKEYGVEYAKVFRDLFRASTEYSDILKYYAKDRFEKRRTNLVNVGRD